MRFCITFDVATGVGAYVINCLLASDKATPCVYAILHHKTQQAYKDFLDILEQHCTSLCPQVIPDPSIVVVDLESAAIAANCQVFGDTTEVASAGVSITLRKRRGGKYKVLERRGDISRTTNSACSGYARRSGSSATVAGTQRNGLVAYCRSSRHRGPARLLRPDVGL